MRFAGKDLARGSYFVPWGGFTDATTSVVKISAMSVSPDDTIVVRPAQVLLTPVSAAPC